MPEQLPGGPYWHVDLGNGRTAPWYILPFDKKGVCTAPLTRQNVVAEARSGRYSDIFVFSHGWNNDWEAASNRYHRFVNGYVKMRRDHGLPMPHDYSPLLVGIFWPSTALVMPWERAPKFAGADEDLGRLATGVDQETRELESVAEAIPDEDREQFYALARKGGLLTPEEARAFAGIVLPIYNTASEAESDAAAVEVTSLTVDDVLDVWSTAASEEARTSGVDEDGFFTAPGGPPSTPQAAGFLGKLDPRNLVRTLTVYQMKDRAGVVGARGIGPLLRQLPGAQPAARVHLVGHSYGAKVVLSALCSGSPVSVHSMLLLQPAVNGWCFSADVDGRGVAGGYVDALSRTTVPILSTYSRNDAPLTKFFHKAVRRADDLGELRVAMAGRPRPPSKYAALGGFGPQGLDDSLCRFATLKSVGDPYDFAGTARVIALNGDEGIDSHGSVEVPQSFWCLYSQVAAGR
jgi:hypothetical protein